MVAAAGWSQRRIAQAMGLSHPQVREYLDGKQEPGFFKVIALANKAEVSLDWLAGREAYLPRVVVDGEPYAPANGAPASDVAGAARALDPAARPARKQPQPTRRSRKSSRPSSEE